MHTQSCGLFSQYRCSSRPRAETFKTPPPGSQATSPSHPSVLQAPHQQIGGGKTQSTRAPYEYAVDPASLLPPTGMAPASTETFGAGPLDDTLVSESNIGQFSPPPHSGTTQLSTGGADNMSSWLLCDGPQSESVTWENRPRMKSVAVAWDPSSSGDAAGYRVYLMTVSALVQYSFDAGPETQLTADLPLGERLYYRGCL
jgi:hypothetical protein